MLSKEKLAHLYISQKKSMQEIADIFHCSLHKVAYWKNKHGIESRSRSEATYIKRNPGGDPFSFRLPRTISEAKLFGIGLGIYWGEGTKANKNSIRLGNTDPKLIHKFMKFLIVFFNIEKNDLRFGLQIFSDISPEKALDFWCKTLTIQKSQFSRPIVTRSGSLGTYRKKSEYGVVTIMYHNKKMRDLLIKQLPR